MDILEKDNLYLEAMENMKFQDNFNVNNTQNIVGDLKNHVTMLESMTPDERVLVIRDIEFYIDVFEINLISTQNLKDKEKLFSQNSKKLNTLHDQIYEKEKEIDECYKQAKADRDEDKMTSCEYQNFKREIKIKCKKTKMELDDLLSITLSQLKIFNKNEMNLKEERNYHKLINDLIIKAKLYLNEARILEMKNEQLKRAEKLKKNNDEMEKVKKHESEREIKHLLPKHPNHRNKNIGHRKHQDNLKSSAKTSKKSNEKVSKNIKREWKSSDKKKIPKKIIGSSKYSLAKEKKLKKQGHPKSNMKNKKAVTAKTEKKASINDGGKSDTVPPLQTKYDKPDVVDTTEFHIKDDIVVKEKEINAKETSKDDNKSKLDYENDEIISNKDDVILSKHPKKYLSENDIIQKRKINQSKFEANFPLEVSKINYEIEYDKDKPTIDKTDNKSIENEEQKNLEKLKTQRIENLKRYEQDRIILKNRDLTNQNQEEQERINKKNKLKEIEDHKSYLKDLHNDKKNHNLKRESQNPNIQTIVKQSRVQFDYQTLLSDSKNRNPMIKYPNLYKLRDITVIKYDDIIEISPGNLEKHQSEDINIVEKDEIEGEIKEEISNEQVELCDDIVENSASIEKSKEYNADDIIKQRTDETETLKDIEKFDDIKISIVNESENIPNEMDKDAKSVINQDEIVEVDNKVPLPIQPIIVEKSTKSCCFGSTNIKKQSLIDKSILPIDYPPDIKSSEYSIAEEISESIINIQPTEKEEEDNPQWNYDINKIVENDEELLIPEHEINNSKFWKRNIYYVEPKSLFEQKIACIIRVKPGQMTNRNLLKCDLISSDDDLPYFDKREDYTSYIFKIYPANDESASKLSFDTPWQIAIPYYLPESSYKQPLIMQVNEEQNRWIECLTYDVIFDNLKQSGLKFVETKMQKPFGTYAVVSLLNKDSVVIDKEGTQLTSTSDRNIVLNVPPDAIKISIPTSLQVTSLDPIFWKEIKQKHEKNALDTIHSSSPVVEIEAKKKKLSSPATLTLSLPIEIPKVEISLVKRIASTNTTYEGSYLEDGKKEIPNKILNPFQKTLLMPDVNSAKNTQDIHLLSYVNDEERWHIHEDPKFNYDKAKEQMHVELPSIQSARYVLLKSKRNTNDESIAKAAKIIDNELCVRNCVIALLQSTNMPSDFALIVSLKKYFQTHVNTLQNEGFVIYPNNKLVYVELKERQILSMEFVGNIKSIIPNLNESKFPFHSVFPNTQKFRVREIDSFAQKAVSSFRGYLDLHTKSLIKKLVPGIDGKIRKNQIQHTFVEENVMICHLLISIKKGKTPKISPFINSKYKFPGFLRCIEVIIKISTKIGLDWWNLGLNLNVTESRMHSIKLHNEERGLHKMAEQMLLFWLKGRETIENKNDLLMTALKLCDRHDIVERLRRPQDKYHLFGC